MNDISPADVARALDAMLDDRYRGGRCPRASNVDATSTARPASSGDAAVSPREQTPCST